MPDEERLHFLKMIFSGIIDWTGDVNFHAVCFKLYKSPMEKFHRAFQSNAIMIF